MPTDRARLERPLTTGERLLVLSMFGTAIDPDPVRLRNWRWWPFQPANVCMAPMGHLHLPPDGGIWRDDYADEPLGWQAFFLHEMTHVWQSQHRGRWWLPLMRHPFCRYGYTITPGRPFARYGIEQQARMVEHVHLLRGGASPPGAAPLATLEALLPFQRSGPAN